MNCLSNTHIFGHCPQMLPSWRSSLIPLPLWRQPPLTCLLPQSTQTSWLWTCICFVNFHVCCWSGAPCLSLKHNLQHCQGRLLDITSHQTFANMQISGGLKGSQEQSFSERTVLQHTNHHSARLPLRQKGQFISRWATVQQPSSQLQPLQVHTVSTTAVC